MMIAGKPNNVLYHQSINRNNSKETMNVYAQHVTRSRKLAMRFYDQEEAIRVATMFDNKFTTFKVIRG